MFKYSVLFLVLIATFTFVCADVKKENELKNEESFLEELSSDIPTTKPFTPEPTTPEPPTPEPPTPAPSHEDSGLSGLQIALIIIVSLIIAFALVFGVLYLRKRQMRTNFEQI